MQQRTPGRRRSHPVATGCVAVGLAIAALAGASCATQTSSPQAAVEPVVDLDPGLETSAVAARDRGADYLAGRFDEIDPLHLSGLGYIHRRWGVADLENAAAAGRERLDALLDSGGGSLGGGSGTAGGASDSVGVSVDPTEILALRRFVTPEYREAPKGDGLSEVAVLITDALYCDVVPVTNEDLARWDALTERGGYEATHVVMAWFVAGDVGCDDSGIAEAGQRAADRVAAEFTARLAAGVDAADVDDLMIEQAAFLERVGRGDILTPAFIEALVAAQLPDGGWPRNVGDTTSDWHATALAVWALSAATTPSADARWVEA